MNLTELKELVNKKIEDIKYDLGDNYYGDPEEEYNLQGKLEVYEQVKKWLEEVLKNKNLWIL